MVLASSILPSAIISASSLRLNQRASMRSSSIGVASPAVRSVGEEDGHALLHEAGADPEATPAWSTSAPRSRSLPSARAWRPAAASRRDRGGPRAAPTRYFSAGSRYWRTSSMRFLSSTAIITAVPMWRTTLRLISKLVFGSTASSSVTRKRLQSYTCFELVIFMIWLGWRAANSSAPAAYS